MKNQTASMAMPCWSRLLLGLTLTLSSLSSFAQTAIEAVSGSIQGGSEVIRIDLSQALAAVPSGFTIQAPARIALDFPGVSNAMGRSTVEVNQGNLRSVSVVQAGDRTRVVVNLKQPTTYKAQLQGKSLLVVLDTVAAVAPAPAAATAPAFAESQSRDSLPIRDLDFRRGTDGAGRVVVALPNSQVGVDVRVQGQTVVVEFLKSTLPEGLRRKLDVADFGTPIKTVTTFQAGDRVRMVIEPSGLWTHSAYQTDDQFVLEVKTLKVDPAKLTQGPGYTGQKLSLNFQSIDIRSLLQVIADFTNFNVITSDSVNGTVTLRLQDVPWDQALDIILQAKNLDKRKTGNVLWIAPRDEIFAKEKQERESAVSLEGLEPLRTQSFQINYAKAAEVASGLTAAGTGAAAGSRILSSRGSVIAEARTNQLFVTDVASKLEQVQTLIAKIDIPVRQVLIEARIVEAIETFGKTLGVRLGMLDARAQNGGDGGYRLSGNNRVAFGTSYENAVGSSGAGGSANATGSFVNFPASSPNGSIGQDIPRFALSIFNAAANRFLTLELSAAEADGKIKTISNPRVVAADQGKALVEQGVELPYQVATSSGATSISFKKATLKLEVTPQITPDGNIILDLDVNKDGKGVETPAGFAIDTRHIKTQVLVQNGGTVVIGGIFTLVESESETKVPLLGDLPGIGNLFKTRSRSSDKTEMLIFITPKMITDSGAFR